MNVGNEVQVIYYGGLGTMVEMLAAWKIQLKKEEEYLPGAIIMAKNPWFEIAQVIARQKLVPGMEELNKSDHIFYVGIEEIPGTLESVYKSVIKGKS